MKIIFEKKKFTIPEFILHMKKKYSASNNLKCMNFSFKINIQEFILSPISSCFASFFVNLLQKAFKK